MQATMIGALVLTYFFSRLTLRLPNPLKKAKGIAFAHGLSFVAVMLLLIAVRGSANAFGAEQLFSCLAFQTFWWLFDLARQHGLGRTKPVSG